MKVLLRVLYVMTLVHIVKVVEMVAMVSSACVLLVMLVVAVPVAMIYYSRDVALFMDIENTQLSSSYTFYEFKIILRYIIICTDI